MGSGLLIHVNTEQETAVASKSGIGPWWPPEATTTLVVFAELTGRLD